MESMFSAHSLPSLLLGVCSTLKISCAAILIGFLGGTTIGVLNSQRIGPSWLKALLCCFVWVVRGTPLFVQVLIIYYALPELLGFCLSPFLAGVLALGINSMAYISEIVKGGIQAIPEGQYEAAFILGLGPWMTIQGIILPQAFRIILPGLTNELSALVKETSILMVIGVSELTKVGKDIVARELNPITIYLEVAALYLVITCLLTIAAQYIERRSHL